MRNQGVGSFLTSEGRREIKGRCNKELCFNNSYMGRLNLAKNSDSRIEVLTGMLKDVQNKKELCIYDSIEACKLMSYIVNNKFLCFKHKTKSELKRSNSEPAFSLKPPAVLKKLPSAIHSDHTDLEPCVEDFSPTPAPIIQDSLDIPMHVINALVEGLENFNYVNKHTFCAIDGGVKSINLIGNSSLINCHMEKLRKNLTNDDFEYASKLPESQQYIKKNKLGNLSFDFKAAYERYLTLDKKDILTREEENEHNFTKDLVVLHQLHKFNSISKGVKEFIRALSGITGIGGYLTFIQLGFTPVTLPLTLIPDFVPAGIELCETLVDKKREKSLNGNNNAYKRFTGDICSIVTDEKKNKDFKNIVKHIFEQGKQVKENPSFRFNLNEVTKEQWDPDRHKVTLAINHLLLMLCSQVFEKAKKGEKLDESQMGEIFNKVVVKHAPKENGNVFTYNKERIRNNEAKNDMTANAISRDITGLVKAIASDPDKIDMLDFLCDKKEYEQWIKSTYRKPKDWDDDKSTQYSPEDKTLSKKGQKTIENFINDEPIDTGIETLEDQGADQNDPTKKLSEKGKLILKNFVDGLPIFTRNEEREFGKLKLDKFKLQAYQGLLQVQAKLLSLAGVSEPAKTLQNLIREKIDASRVDQFTSLVLEGTSDKSTKNKSFLNRFKEHLNGLQENLVDIIKEGLGALSLDERTKLREGDIPDYDELKNNDSIFAR